MRQTTKFAAGTYLKKRDGYIAVRKIGSVSPNGGFEYIELFPDSSGDSRRWCSGNQLRKWGEPISESEARQLIPTLDQQIANLEIEERDKGNELIADVLRAASDESLIQEIERRGYKLERSTER
jgi:hypothetical protein